jgi:hypothetical protein
MGVRWGERESDSRRAKGRGERQYAHERDVGLDR